MEITMTQNKIIKFSYRLSVTMLIITGFAQMPIFKRYYVADIPGFGWLAQFYTTHLLHYVFSALFLLCVFWYATLYAGIKINRKALTKSLIFQITLYAGLILSGFILVLNNFPVHYFSERMIILADFIHLGLVMIFLVFSGGVLIYNRIKKEGRD